MSTILIIFICVVSFCAGYAVNALRRYFTAIKRGKISFNDLFDFDEKELNTVIRLMKELNREYTKLIDKLNEGVKPKK